MYLSALFKDALVLLCVYTEHMDRARQTSNLSSHINIYSRWVAYLTTPSKQDQVWLSVSVDRFLHDKRVDPNQGIRYESGDS